MYIYIDTYVCIYNYIYIYMCVCVCVISFLNNTFKTLHKTSCRLSHFFSAVARLASELELGGFVGSVGFVPTDSKGWLGYGWDMVGIWLGYGWDMVNNNGLMVIYGDFS